MNAAAAGLRQQRCQGPFRLHPFFHLADGHGQVVQRETRFRQIGLEFWLAQVLLQGLGEIGFMVDQRRLQPEQIVDTALAAPGSAGLEVFMLLRDCFDDVFFRRCRRNVLGPDWSLTHDDGGSA